MWPQIYLFFALDSDTWVELIILNGGAKQYQSLCLKNMEYRAYVNVPNALSVTRLLGVPFLFLLVEMDNKTYFLSWYIFLGITDWLDGKLARAWKQATDFGSMLDSVADLAYYISTAYFLIVLFPEYVIPSLPHLYVFFSILGLSFLISWWRAGKIIMLHSHINRLNGVLVFFAMILSFFFDTTMLVRIIIYSYYIAFAESILIFLIYGNVSPDTRSIFDLRKNLR